MSEEEEEDDEDPLLIAAHAQVHGQNIFKDSKSYKCRLCWSFIEFIDWRYRSVMSVFSTPLVN
jgi:hypothetical protein